MVAGARFSFLVKKKKILTLASLIKEQPEQSYIGIQTPKKHAGLDIYSEAKSARRCEESKSTHIRAESLAMVAN